LSRFIAGGKLDRRTWIARALAEIRRELAADAGGFERMTARERVLLDRCAAATLICSTIEAHVFGHDPITDAGELMPILRRGYVTHVQSLSRMLQALGLRPARGEKLPTLTEYLAARATVPEPVVGDAAEPAGSTIAAPDGLDPISAGDRAAQPDTSPTEGDVDA
jgi:hypothetical protein